VERTLYEDLTEGERGTLARLLESLLDVRLD
jgi:hypothetical protein